jgi:hypothetical protein
MLRRVTSRMRGPPSTGGSPFWISHARVEPAAGPAMSAFPRSILAVCGNISRRAIYRRSYSGRKRRPDGSLAQMASEEINQPFMVLIFRVAAQAVPLSLVKMYLGSPAMLLQSFP